MAELLGVRERDRMTEEVTLGVNMTRRNLYAVADSALSLALLEPDILDVDRDNLRAAQRVLRELGGER